LRYSLMHKECSIKTIRRLKKTNKRPYSSIDV